MLGERLGPYKLEVRLGSGGMGDVYRAYDERLDRRVAIKHIRPEIAEEPQVRERLRREARSAARLSHPAVVQIYDILETDAGDSIVMELVEGESLASLVRRGRLGLDRTLRLAIEISAALDAAHSKGIVHRDLKSENVVVTPDYHAKVLDFGIAKILETTGVDQDLTHEGAVIGTFKAMSPEQAAGRTVGPASDLFSFGLLLYEMLSGKPPFKGPDPATTVARILGERQAPLRGLRDEVPPRLSDLVDRLLEKDPADRPESAAAVTVELEAIAGVAAIGDLTSSETMVRTEAAPATPPVDTQTVGERRQITVMRCDLVIAAGGETDPEEVLEAFPVFQKIVGEVVEEYGGHLWQIPGKSLAVYFGYPRAREDDARRAVHAGLDIVERAGGTLQEPGHGLSARVGLHTGLLVVSQDETTREPTTLGDVPEVAFAVQGVAGPGEVLLTTSTRRLVRRHFDCEARPDTRVPGRELELFRVLGERQVEGRLELAVAGRATPLVARESELKLLHERWESIQGGRGQVVLLSAEAGVGKSRLLGELVQKLAPEKPAVLACFGSPFHGGSSLYPIREMLRRLLEPAPGAEEADSLRRLEAELRRYRLPPDDFVPLLASLLDIDLRGEYEPPNLGPEVLRQRTLESVLTLLMEIAEDRPLLLAFEDLHWADPSSLEFLGMLLDQAAATRILAVLTYRPEFSPPWAKRSYITFLTLSPLSGSQVEPLIRQVAGGKPLPAEVVEEIVERSDGVPLFAEELTKSLLESKLLRESEAGWELVGSVQALHIPATLNDSLMARLDRLGTAKGVAQRAAALGRDFSLQLLGAVSPWEPEILEPALQSLVDAELLHQRGFGTRAHYYFNHALIRDAAYESLLKSERKKLHRRIAEALEGEFPETARSQPELVAHHWTEAARFAEAVASWHQAGLLALERSALIEATHHLKTGLDLIPKLPESDDRHHRELRLLTALGGALSNARGFAAPEVDDAYQRALELCGRIGEVPELFDVYWGLRRFHLVRSHIGEAMELGDRLVRLAELEGDPQRLVSAYFSVGVPRFCRGEFERAHEVLERGIEADSLERTEHYATQVNEDSGVGVLCWDAWTLWFLGLPQQALDRIAQANQLAEAISHPLSVTYARLFDTYLSFFLHDPERTLDSAERLSALCRQHGSWWSTLAEMFLGWSQALGAGADSGADDAGAAEGGGARSLERIERGIEGYLRSGARILQPQMLSLLGEAALRHGRPELAQRSFGRALEAIRDTGEHLYEAEVHRLHGELALASDDEAAAGAAASAAESAFTRALALARQQGAGSLELRSAASIARLWSRAGRKQQALEVLEPVFRRFTEGLETPDLREAAALLEELG